MIYGPASFYDDGHPIKKRGSQYFAPKAEQETWTDWKQLPRPDTDNRHRAAILTLRDRIGPDAKTSLAAVKVAISIYSGVPENYLISARREKGIMRARLIYYWLAKELTTASLPMIGRACGDRDHTTVLSGLRKVAKYMPDFGADIAEVKKLLGVGEAVQRMGLR